jgi:hypothetical protein
MSTLASKVSAAPSVKITGVRFTDTMVYLALNDQREVGLPLRLRDLRWLAEATPEQRANWVIGPGGRSVLWDELNDGIEVEHLFKDHQLM